MDRTGTLELEPSSFAPHRYQRRTSERARAIEYWPGTTPPTKSALLPASSLATCDLVSQLQVEVHHHRPGRTPGPTRPTPTSPDPREHPTHGRLIPDGLTNLTTKLSATQREGFLLSDVDNQDARVRSEE